MDPDLKSSADALLAAGRWQEARALLEELASRPDCTAAVVRQLAEVDILGGEADRAMRRLDELPAQDEEAEFVRARAEIALGRLAGARDRLLALRARLAVPSAMVELQLGGVHQHLDETEPAIEAFRAAVRLNPRLARAHRLLGAALSQAGRADEARAVLESAIEAWPGDVAWRVALATAHTHAGNGPAAIDALDAAVKAGPQDAPTWASIGYLYAEHLVYEPADHALGKAWSLSSGATDEPMRAGVKQELGDNAGALQVLEAAQVRDPGDLRVAIARRLYLPQSYDGVAEVAQWRRRYVAGLDALEGEARAWVPRAADVFNLARSNFFLAYQGEDDRELQRRYSALIAGLAGASAPHLRAPMPVAYDGSRRVRVGFFGNVFRESTTGRYFERWVTSLDPARFESFVYHAAPASDALTGRVASAAGHFFDRRLDTRATAELIRSHALDILVYPEVGMNSMTCVLAALRLAPVQCAGWGHPVTTGSDVIDYYLTCAEMEPPDAQQHYTERLVGLPGLGVDYAMPAAEAPAQRSALGLRDDAHVYCCTQSLFKIHPEMDALFARILAQDPRGVLVFFQAPARAVTEQLASRMQRALAACGVAPRGQVKFMPRMPGGAAFRRALGAADIVLDTVRFSGGNTSLDTFAAAVPVVSLEGRFMRGRQTAAMLSMMGLRRLVARDADEYVRLAVEVARDRDLQASIRAAIAVGREALFGRPEPVAAFADALERMARG